MVKTLTTLICLLTASITFAQDAAVTEDDYYPILTPEWTETPVLEAGGLTLLSDGRLMFATRRGEVFIVENAYSDPFKPVYKRYAFGLQQPLGLQEHDGWIYFAQRGELSRMKDTNGDDKADVFETVCDDWAISGNYHEYNFGPRIDKEGYFWVTLNKPFGGEPYGRAHWRGWAVRVDPKTGKMHSMCNGLRSPAGIEVSPAGDAFFTDNQGEWCNASKLSHLEYGDFHGHPHGLPTVELPEATIKEPKPGSVPSGEYMKDLHKKIPNFKMPAVWFPYRRMGSSPAGMVWDQSEGKFGPFSGQLFVSDQKAAMVMRVYLEKIDGHWQGACFNFRRGFQCGITRVTFGKDSSMFVGMTNRGWGGLGTKPWGLERCVWNGKVPMDVHEMHAKPDGFEMTFTHPVDASVAGDVTNYAMTSYTYKLESRYGGPDVDTETLKITSAKVADDGKSVRITVDSLRAGFVHELTMSNIKAKDGTPLLHPKAYYTLVKIPGK